MASFFGNVNASSQFDSDDASVQLNIRIEQLKASVNSPYGYKDIIHGNDRKNECDLTTIHNIVQRCMYLISAYQHALDNMNAWTWNQCCVAAVHELDSFGYVVGRSPRTIERWNCQFRSTGHFPNPIIHKKKIHPYLTYIPKLRKT